MCSTDVPTYGAEGYASSGLSATAELDTFVAAYQDCPDFNDIFIMVHLIRNVVVWYAGKVFDDTHDSWILRKHVTLEAIPAYE